jgi:uncharacterized membrane protein YraQ (UPF0718 family)
VLGLAIAGAVAAWVPESFWRHFFFTGHPLLAKIWGPLVGPLVAVVSFVCSIGNVPLAAVLWNGGISFGGVVAFIYADLIVIPVLLIYRKYYGTRTALFLGGTFYASMAAAGYVIELVFQPLGLVPVERNATAVEAHFSWNYTSVLNIAFLVLALFLAGWFVRTGGLPMLRMTGGGPAPQTAHGSPGGHDSGHRNHGGTGHHVP